MMVENQTNRVYCRDGSRIVGFARPCVMIFERYFHGCRSSYVRRQSLVRLIRHHEATPNYLGAACVRGSDGFWNKMDSYLELRWKMPSLI